MKRYIRLKDNRIIDMEDNVITNEPMFNSMVLAESDTITDLIRAGDLVKFTAEEEGNKEEYVIEIKTDTQVVLFIANIVAGDVHLTKLYTNQSDNYILVWDKERGII